MHSGQVVRWVAYADGVKMKVWVYDKRAEFVAAAEVWIDPGMLEGMAIEVTAEQQRSDQYQLEFDK